ncbi:hypothetical protein C2S51_037413 [Perilla frutescens var. frutescens]|nr:hypothetical protein C2S51_037413 [Perilla frutescens var. frutescens]
MAAVNPPSTATLHSLVTHKPLIRHLESTLPPLSTAIQSPLRHAHQITPNSSFLLMPSWSTSPHLPYIGTKLVTHNSGNSALNLPGVHAIFVLFNSATGQPLASMDATALTLYRTACVSALASSYLSREDAEILVMVGAGALAPHLIKAHLTVRSNVKRVLVWNRTVEKARDISRQARGGVEGGHLDLVGSFTPSMRECDDEAVRRGRVFVDNEVAAVEAGELVGAFERGVMRKDEIAGELVKLIRREKIGRRSEEEITVFKFVGSAVVDGVQKPETSRGFWFLVRQRQPVTSVALSEDDSRVFWIRRMAPLFTGMLMVGSLYLWPSDEVFKSHGGNVELLSV